VRVLVCTGVAAAACLLASCSKPSPAPPPKSESLPAKITQFYASPPAIGRGEKTLLCYGVENAKAVTLAPGNQTLSAALSRCIDVTPAETTTYTLTAEGDGPAAKQETTVTVGAAKPPGVKIIEVKVSSLDLKRGEPLSICYKVSNAKSVKIDPAVPPSNMNPNCGIAHPERTTTYTVTAVGAGGDQDQERVTVKVH
jgi:hypothetical protein